MAAPARVMSGVKKGLDYIVENIDEIKARLDRIEKLLSAGEKPARPTAVKKK